jgi:hypothetical protein
MEAGVLSPELEKGSGGVREITLVSRRALTRPWWWSSEKILRSGWRFM